jgi:PhzF family phenazine biosynthesis protein
MSASPSICTSTFRQVDVFTSVPFRGNPLAVLLDADDLDAAAMQRIAAWTNLSETAFVLRPTKAEASYRVRIFTPRSELPFAGHPSVGTAYSLIEAGRLDAAAPIVQECAAGLLPIRVIGSGHGRQVFVRSPRPVLHAPDAETARAAASVLGVELTRRAPPRLVTAGPSWLICELDDEAAVRALKPDMAAIAALTARGGRAGGAVGISVFGRSTNGTHSLTVRAFAPGDGVPEDPVTGSANAAIGAYLLATGGLDAVGAEYRVSQGREIGRDGYVDVRVDAATGDVEIGGHVVTCVDGMLLLPTAGCI